MALEAVASGYADMVAWGKDFIANPDLVERLRRDAPLNPGRASSTTAAGPRAIPTTPAGGLSPAAGQISPRRPLAAAFFSQSRRRR